MPPPGPILPNVATQDVVAKTTPAIQAQAAATIIQRAVDPSPKSDKGGQTRSNRDRAKGGDGSDKTTDGGKSGSVNIRV